MRDDTQGKWGCFGRGGAAKYVLALFFTLLFGTFSLVGIADTFGGKKERWVGTWSASPLPADAVFFAENLGFENQTIRQIVRLSVGGKQVRIRFSNAYSASPLLIGAAHVAKHREGGAIVPESDRTLTFSGASSVSIPPGGLVVSDPVQLNVPACAELAVSIYAPQSTGPATWHEIARQTTYVSSAGDFTSSTSIPVEATHTARFWLSGVDVQASRRMSSMVAFGDSITDGWESSLDQNQRWPDILSEQVNCSTSKAGKFGRMGILNQGVSGNRILNDFLGPNALARFDQDVLAQTGVKSVFIQVGINDIGFTGAFGLPQDVTAEDIILGLSQLVTRAKAKKLSVYGATLAPFEGTTLPGYFTEEGEQKRVAVNNWIRNSGVFDKVVDFDVVLQDPEQPTRLLPEYDSGDHLHPSDAGYRAIAGAVYDVLFGK